MISVIVPAYNAQNYIKECLLSLSVQTYKDFEVIVVDDGSTDQTREIIRKCSLMDYRIKPYYNENHGVSYSRNYALERCSGEYIAFVDSDDIVSEDFLEILINNLLKYVADMSAVGVVKSKRLDSFTEGDEIVFEGEEVLGQLFGIYEGFLCNKLFKKSLLNDLLLNQTIGMCEDLLFNVQYLKKCNRSVYYTGKKYFYRQISNSAVNRLDNKKWFDSIEAFRIMLPLLEEYPCVKLKAVSGYAFHLCEGMYRMKYVPEFKEKVMNEWKNVMKMFKLFSMKYKIKIILFRCFPSLVMKYRRRKL